VYSIFPTGPIPGTPLGPVARNVRVVVLAGDRDEVVGTAGAQELYRHVRNRPARLRQYRLVRSSAALVAHHEAPKDGTAAAFRTFWAPLDRLVSAARRR
jgi:hypothetical protein